MAKEKEDLAKQKFQPKDACRKCGESIWQYESMSPNMKSATWVCGYCGKKEIVREGAIPIQDKDINLRNAIPKAVQREVWRRDQGRCVECGNDKKLEYDHIIPVSQGGSNTARNIQLLCEPCNRKKSNRIG